MLYIQYSCGLDERRGAVLVYAYEPLIKYADLYFAYAEISSLAYAEIYLPHLYFAICSQL